MINRSDGLIGFPGGMVEAGESPSEAALREVSEEIGHSVSVTLDPLVAYDIGPIVAYVFTAEVSYEQLRKMQESGTEAEHFGSEVTGIFLPHLVDYEGIMEKDAGLVNLLRSSMAQSVPEELMHFLLKRDLVDKASLENLCLRAGYSLEELLK